MCLQFSFEVGCASLPNLQHLENQLCNLYLLKFLTKSHFICQNFGWQPCVDSCVSQMYVAFLGLNFRMVILKIIYPRTQKDAVNYLVILLTHKERERAMEKNIYFDKEQNLLAKLKTLKSDLQLLLLLCEKNQKDSKSIELE